MLIMCAFQVRRGKQQGKWLCNGIYGPRFCVFDAIRTRERNWRCCSLSLRINFSLSLSVSLLPKSESTTSCLLNYHLLRNTYLSPKYTSRVNVTLSLKTLYYSISSVFSLFSARMIDLPIYRKHRITIITPFYSAPTRLERLGYKRSEH